MVKLGATRREIALPNEATPNEAIASFCSAFVATGACGWSVPAPKSGMINCCWCSPSAGAWVVTLLDCRNLEVLALRLTGASVGIKTGAGVGGAGVGGAGVGGAGVGGAIVDDVSVTGASVVVLEVDTGTSLQSVSTSTMHPISK